MERKYEAKFQGNPEKLKAFLEIKRQLAYVRENHAKSLINFPDNKVAHASWESMANAYEIALQILNGEEL
jgi:hypothetical protein